MDNRYVIPLTNFKYNRQAIVDAQHNHKNYEANPLFMDYNGVDTVKDCLMFDLTKFKYDVTVDLCARFNFETDDKFTKVLAGGVMPAHIDPLRTAVVMFPLTDKPSPIHYYDESMNELFNYTYEGVTIINAKIKHGVPVNNSDRIFYQVNCYLPWEEVVTMYKENKLYDQQ
jgi:hypothetical protein